MIRARAYAVGAALALAAGLHKGLLASFPVNDDFMHRAYARQLIAGEWPLRDFFDYGMGLMYVLTALAEQAFGHRLFSEAVIIGTACGISTFLAYTVVRRLTASMACAALAGVLLLLVGPRGYAYPKLLIYAVAAALWWGYVRAPRAPRAIALGVWTAVAYYWRPDHGLLVAFGATLAMVAAHGVTAAAIRRCVVVGATTIALVVPFWIFAATQVGFRAFVRSGLTAAVAQHRVSQAGPRWPLRQARDFVTIDPADIYAPRIRIRWSPDSSPDQRSAVLARHQLTVESSEDAQSQVVRLSEHSIGTLRDLVANPIVDDTAGVTRSSGTLPWGTWPTWERWRFGHSWLRVRLFPAIDEHTSAGAMLHVMLFAIAFIAIILGILPATKHHLPDGLDGMDLAWFAVFAAAVSVALIRTPYEIRGNDAIVLPAIVFGISSATALRLWSSARGLRRWLTAVSGALFLILLLKSVAVTGQFGSTVGWLAGDWRSMERARGAWREAHARLWATPPVAYWEAGRGPLTTRFAAYAHACVPPRERVLVLWFAPEVYYQSDRLMAGRHLHFTPAFRALDAEQRLEIEKVRRTAPPIAFAQGAVDAVGATFPALIEYVGREYQRGASVTDDGDEYTILVRRDRQPVGRYGDAAWPCYR